MSATIYRLVRHAGKYRVEWIDEQGGRHRRSLGSNDPATAAARFADFKSQAERLSRPERATIGQIVNAYIEDRSPEITLPQRLKDAWKALRPVFGHIFPEHVTKAVCQEYRALRHSAGRSDGTTHVELGLLRAALRWAEKSKWIEHAPYVWMPSKPPARERYLTREEADRLIAGAGMPHVRLFIIVALHTGARAGAILDLTWDRIDFDRGRIDLRNPGRAETRKGRAIVPLTETLREALQEARTGAVTPWVIEWAGKRVYSIKKGFARAVERAGVGPCSPHVLRHTACVWMAEAGVPMTIIAAYLGHADSRTTERNYLKFSPDFLAQAAKALDWRR